MSELPTGWAYGQLPDLIGTEGVFIDGDWVESKDQDPDGNVRLIQLADIGDGYYVDKSNRFLTHSRALVLGCTFLKKGDVLIARMPDPLGRACVFPGDNKVAVTVVDVCVVRGRPVHFDNAWLMYFVNAPSFREHIHAMQSGSTRKRISRGNLSTLQLPIPPRAEQTRIAEKLEEVLSDLDAGVAELKAAQKKLARYRQSLLKAAVGGELTAEWRAERERRGESTESGAQLLAGILTERRACWEAKQLARFREQGKPRPKGWKDKYPEPVGPDTTALPALPEGWVWVALDQLVEMSSYGTSIKCSYQSDGEAVVRIPNVVGRSLSLQDLKFATQPLALDQSEYLTTGDILVVRTNGSIKLVGRAAEVIDTPPRNVYFASYLLRLRCVDSVSVPSWISAFLGSSKGRTWIEKRAASSAGQHNVSLSTLLTMPIPLAPLSEQIASRRTLAAQLDGLKGQDIATDLSLKHSSAQRKNILKAAFSGQLVPQDPDDEPASVLLERIRAEREKSAKVGRTKRPKKHA